MNSKRLMIGAFTLAFGLIVTGLTSPVHSAKADNEPVKITLNMDEYHFIVEGQQPNTPLELKAGQPYQMTIKNTGKLKHEIQDQGRDDRDSALAKTNHGAARRGA